MTQTDNLAYSDVPHSSSEGPPAASAHETVEILGIPFARVVPIDAIALIRAMLRTDRCHHVVLANTHTLNYACGDPRYRQVLQEASLVLRDGAGVELAAKALGRRLEHNFVGTDFTPLLLGALATPRVRVFLFGAAPGVAVTAGRALTDFSPGVDIVGSADGYGDFDAVIEQIQSLRPDVLLVAFGNPLQEEWIAANLPRLGARVAIGVGALFDFLAGRVPRAPRWVRKARCEWAYRLCLEPRRLWRRYLIGNAQFLWRIARARRANA